MYFVIARKQFRSPEDGSICQDEFDFDHPIGVYEDYDLQVASQHAFTHTMNHGVETIVVKDIDLDVVKKTAPGKEAIVSKLN